MSAGISKLFIQLAKRAEKIDRKALIDSFVDVGPLLTALSTVDNQILYGRRGTGKTHALIYLAEVAQQKGDISAYVDLRSIGSTGGLYSDVNTPLVERATRLLMDTIAAIHDELTRAVIEKDEINLAEIGPILDDLAAAITEVGVSGDIKQEVTQEAQSGARSSVDAGFKADLGVAGVNLGSSNTTEQSDKLALHVTREGKVSHRVHFGRLGNVLSRLQAALQGKRLWILLDEWSVVPIELQPYLADLIRRALFPVQAFTVKIGAIEKRSKFQLKVADGDYIGIELGGDASADLNMDDFMVFDNDEAKAVQFFRTLIYRHLKAAVENSSEVPVSEHELVRNTFTQENVFGEFVRAAEGIPRDAFYILSLAAQKDFAQRISMETIRRCSKTWYQRDKEAAVSANAQALDLLHWIFDEVIAHRRARAFLLQRGASDELVDTLFDSRVLHLLKRNISAHDQPGVRYDVYKIDYGCYVDLLSTAKAPQGLLELENGDFAKVPPDDYRAIRRAILDLNAFVTRPAQLL